VRPHSQFLHSCICERFTYSQDRSAYLTAAKKADRSWEYINCSQIHQCGNWETEHYKADLEITRLRRSFLGIHKSEPNIYRKRPKFGNGPLVRHPLFEVLKNHISAWSEVSDQVQRGERLYIFFWTNKKNQKLGVPIDILWFAADGS
jgi:hypothetical protein